MSTRRNQHSSRCVLLGGAQLASQRLPEATRASYEDTKKALKERFETPGTKLAELEKEKRWMGRSFRGSPHPNSREGVTDFLKTSPSANGPDTLS